MMSQKVELNYFTCTLGQAKSINDGKKEFASIQDLIEKQSAKNPDLFAVGFPEFTENGEPRRSHLFTFQHVEKGSRYVSRILAEHTRIKSQTVALLCRSTPEFLFTWLGLIRLGCSVLLIAPQCKPPAVTHLCESCSTTTLIYDEHYSELVEESRRFAANEKQLAIESLPITWSVKDPGFQKSIERESDNSFHCPPKQRTDSDTAYFFHTSGTSSGLPKTIPQSHNGAVGALPHFLDGREKATFSTTPLYHGGIADLFRAWTSNALIWLFPGDVQITAGNVKKCLLIARDTEQSVSSPPVRYFSSVPYVLQTLFSDNEGLQWLRNMDIVGVGGAALAPELGDELVKKGVNLVSRYGSAECGFLMSSHRDYDQDLDWQYLRNVSDKTLTKFEAQPDGTSELIVQPAWPHRAKTNRPDGAFATADLFAPHPTTPKAWRYHSRADSQLTLVTGKKFDPAPLEMSIATSPFLSDVLIFGNGQPFPGALLFRSRDAEKISDEDLVNALAPHVESLNKDSQDHARIPRNMLVPIPYGNNTLEKSSKGTVLRNKAEETYHTDIENAYSRLMSATETYVSDDEINDYLSRSIQKITGKTATLGLDEDLFSYGADSVASIQIRFVLSQLCPAGHDIPFNIVEDSATIRGLSDFIMRARHGTSEISREDETELMWKLVEDYSDFKSKSSVNGTMKAGYEESEKGQAIVLTGATGALGAQVLDFYRKSAFVSKIYCLVRGANKRAAVERVNKSLTQRGLQGQDGDVESNGKVEVLQAKLSEPDLGLGTNQFNILARSATTIMHLAWAVNFRMRLRSFVKDHIAGLYHLIQLALASPRSQSPVFIFCSSLASVTKYQGSREVPEMLSGNPDDASGQGYSRSKWVAEQICARANAQPSLKNRIAAFRVGQLSGDTKKGIWNSKEAWPLMLSSVSSTSCLPDLGDEPLSWLPVDVAAEALIQSSGSMEKYSRIDHDHHSFQVYHILNGHQYPQWRDLLNWMIRRTKFETVSPEEWIRRLESLQNQETHHPALQLLEHWKHNLVGAGSKGQNHDSNGTSVKQSFHTEKAKTTAPILQEVQPVSEEYFGKLWTWIRDNVK